MTRYASGCRIHFVLIQISILCLGCASSITLPPIDTASSTSCINKSIALEYKKNFQESVPEDISKRGFITSAAIGFKSSDIKTNAIDAVVGAIKQSLREYRLKAISNIENIVRFKPPLLGKTKQGYYLLAKNPLKPKKGLKLRIITRLVKVTESCQTCVFAQIYSRVEDRKISLDLRQSLSQSSYYEALMDGERVLRLVDLDKGKELKKLLRKAKNVERKPFNLSQMVFGDIITLLPHKKSGKKKDALYMDEGIFSFVANDNSIYVCKFGEEEFFRYKIDTKYVKRPSGILNAERFKPPPEILVCLYEKYTLRRDVRIKAASL